MKRPLLGLLLAALGVLAGSLGAAVAADMPCSSLLQGRVLDLRDTRSFDSRVAHFRDVVCRREYADIADYRRLDDMAGGTLDGAVGAFGFRGDGLSWQLAREKICGPRAKLGETLKPYFVQLRAADRGLMQAFQRCLVNRRWRWACPCPPCVRRLPGWP